MGFIDLTQQLQEVIQQAVQQVFSINVPLSTICLQPTPKEFVGTHTFVTFSLAGNCKQSPEQIAFALGDWLKQHTHMIANFNVVKGFLNLCIADGIWLEQLAVISQSAHDVYLKPRGEKVVIEFSSPNTNKPLHLGHLRNNFLGHAMAQILQAVGCEVVKVSLVNDRGIHICKSMLAYQRFGHGETPASANMKGDHLVGKYYVLFEKIYKEQVAKLTKELGDEKQASKEAPILQEAQAMLRRWEEGDPVVLDLWHKMNSWVYQGFEETYQLLDIAFDKVYYESQTYLRGKQVVAEGLKKGIFYQKQDGSVWTNLVEVGLGEKLLLRADGTSVYLTQDLGGADQRYKDNEFDKSIYVVGNEQDHYFEVLTRILHQLKRPYASKLVHLSYGMVSLPSGKMKSREGTVVDADNLIATMLQTAAAHTQQLGKIEGFTHEEAKKLYHQLAMGALKYFLLRVDAKKDLIFDPQASIDFQGNTGPFIQYTHARIAAVLRKAQEKEITIHPLQVEGNKPLHAVERDVILQLCKFPQKLQEAADSLAPVVLAQYVFDLAKVYNRFYVGLSILYEPDAGLRNRRLCISECVAKNIRHSMYLLGIEVPERM